MKSRAIQLRLINNNEGARITEKYQCHVLLGIYAQCHESFFSNFSILYIFLFQEVQPRM